MKAILKGMLVILATLALFGALVKPAKANGLEEVEGATLVRQGTCTWGGIPVPCAVYTKNGVQYVMYADDRGLMGIFRIREGAQQPYKSEDQTQIWLRAQPTAATI